jgi:hypothetical protein
MHTSHPVQPSGWTIATSGDFFFFFATDGTEAAGRVGAGAVSAISSEFVDDSFYSYLPQVEIEYTKGYCVCQELLKKSKATYNISFTLSCKRTPGRIGVA